MQCNTLPFLAPDLEESEGPAMLWGMSTPKPLAQRLDLARELIREKGLSKQDLGLLEEILKLGEGDLAPMLDTPASAEAGPVDSLPMVRLRRGFGLFLAFLNHFNEKRLGEVRLGDPCPGKKRTGCYPGEPSGEECPYPDSQQMGCCLGAEYRG